MKRIIPEIFQQLQAYLLAFLRVKLRGANCASAKLKTSLHHAAIHAQGCAVRSRREHAANIDYQIGNFFSRRKSFEQRTGSDARKKFLLKLGERFAAAQLVDEFIHAVGMSRAGQHGVDGHTRAGAGLGDTARNGQLRGLGHAVMDHFDGSLDAALAADEHDAAPVFLFHSRQIRAA